MTYEQYVEMIKNFFETHQALALVLIFSVLALVLLAVCATWFLFEKAGEKGWKALVPFYNLFTLCKLVWNKKVFWEMFILFVVLVFLVVWQIIFASTAGWLGIALFVAVCICLVWLLANLLTLQAQIAYSFGKTGWFVAGIIFFCVIFLCILAFGKSLYVGNKSQEQF